MNRTLRQMCIIPLTCAWLPELDLSAGLFVRPDFILSSTSSATKSTHIKPPGLTMPPWLTIARATSMQDLEVDYLRALSTLPSFGELSYHPASAVPERISSMLNSLPNDGKLVWSHLVPEGSKRTFNNAVIAIRTCLWR